MIDNNCVFCISKLDVISENKLALAFFDKYPVTNFHVLIIPKRHVKNYFDLDILELNAIQELLFEQINNLINNKFTCKKLIGEDEIRKYDAFGDDKALDRVIDEIYKVTVN